MTAKRRQVALYRRITVMYPRSFRAEYRDDLVGMFAAQLSDESAVRVWCRAARDLATTVPTQRLEARMQRRSMNATALFCGAVAVTGLLSAALFGTSPVSILLLVVVLLASVLTVLAHRGGHSVSAERAVRRWWQFLAAGAGLLVLVVIVENSPFRTLETSSNGRWYASFLTVVLSVVLLSTGLILAIGRLFDRRTPNV